MASDAGFQIKLCFKKMCFNYICIMDVRFTNASTSLEGYTKTDQEELHGRGDGVRRRRMVFKENPLSLLKSV